MPQVLGDRLKRLNDEAGTQARLTVVADLLLVLDNCANRGDFEYLSGASELINEAYRISIGYPWEPKHLEAIKMELLRGQK